MNLTENQIRALVNAEIAKARSAPDGVAVPAQDANQVDRSGSEGVNASIAKRRFADHGGGYGSGKPFPKASYAPFRWAWNGATMTLTIGNIMLYTPNGTLTTMADADTVLAAGDHYPHLTYTHDGGAIDIGVAASLAAAQTEDADRAAGIQKIPLYHFTVTGTACVCMTDYIHHGAVGTIYR